MNPAADDEEPACPRRRPPYAERPLLLAGLLLAFASRPRRGAEPVRTPNIILIVADDLGWNDVGYHGSEIRTPNLDALAGVGREAGAPLRLADLLADPRGAPDRPEPEPVRHPRADRRPERAGAAEGDGHAGRRPEGRRGYATAMTGKWHLGLRPEVGPRQYGFDASYGYLHGQVDPTRIGTRTATGPGTATTRSSTSTGTPPT